MTRITNIAPVQSGASLMVAWRLNQKAALVVGGGSVATGRVAKLLECDATVTVVAPELSPQLRRQQKEGRFTWKERGFCEEDVVGVSVVLSAVDDPKVSERVAAACKEHKIPANVADVPDLCDFWFPSVHRDGPIQLSVLSNGQGPSISARLRRELARALPAQASLAIERFGMLRTAIRTADPAASSSPHRMNWLKTIGTHWSYPDLCTLDEATIASLVASYLRKEAPPAEPHPQKPDEATQFGAVTIVGAGPGDPGLLTVSAMEALRDADMVVADRLIPHEILDLVHGELRIARKYPGRSAEAQKELQRWVMEAAWSGKNVVRLKCGDAFVFGRTFGELTAYEHAKLDVSIIPGVSSALAAPVLAGIPTTLRGVADRFTVLTGQGASGAKITVPDYEPNATIMLLMGVGRAGSLRRDMLAQGYPQDLPVAIVERASHDDERTLVTSLDQLETIIELEHVAAPAVIIFGHVVRHGRGHQITNIQTSVQPQRKRATS